MKFRVLEIRIGQRRVGHLFQYGDIIRLNVDPGYANDTQRPVLSLSVLAGAPEQQVAFFLDQLNPALNSLGEGKLPAYDVVAYSVYLKGEGHALAFAHGLPKRQILDPRALRALSNATGLPEAPLRKLVRTVCERALSLWPAMIADSDPLPEQKERLSAFFMARPLMLSLLKRRRADA